jgi:glutaredoxin 3
VSREVIVYSTPLCPPCERLKAHLRERGVAFRVRDLMMDEEAAGFLAGRGIRSTPVLQVGDELVVGFQPDRVDELLGP